MLAGVIDGSFGQLFQQMMSLAVEDTVALLDGGLADGLGQVTFAGARWTENEGILVASDEGAGGQIENQAAVHFGIEGEVKAVQGFVGITELSLLAPAFQQPVTTAGQLIADQARDQVDGRRNRPALLPRVDVRPFPPLADSRRRSLAAPRFPARYSVTTTPVFPGL